MVKYIQNVESKGERLWISSDGNFDLRKQVHGRRKLDQSSDAEWVREAVGLIRSEHRCMLKQISSMLAVACRPEYTVTSLMNSAKFSMCLIPTIMTELQIMIDNFEYVFDADLPEMRQLTTHTAAPGLTPPGTGNTLGPHLECPTSPFKSLSLQEGKWSSNSQNAKATSTPEPREIDEIETETPEEILAAALGSRSSSPAPAPAPEGPRAEADIAPLAAYEEPARSKAQPSDAVSERRVETPQHTLAEWSPDANSSRSPRTPMTMNGSTC